MWDDEHKRYRRLKRKHLKEVSVSIDNLRYNIQAEASDVLYKIRQINEDLEKQMAGFRTHLIALTDAIQEIRSALNLKKEVKSDLAEDMYEYERSCCGPSTTKRGQD